MSDQALGNLFIGLGGTIIALVTPEKAAVFAGVSTGLWMLCQCAGWAIDRYRAFRDEKRR